MLCENPSVLFDAGRSVYVGWFVTSILAAVVFACVCWRMALNAQSAITLWKSYMLLVLCGVASVAVLYVNGKVSTLTLRCVLSLAFLGAIWLVLISPNAAGGWWAAVRPQTAVRLVIILAALFTVDRDVEGFGWVKADWDRSPRRQIEGVVRDYSWSRSGGGCGRETFTIDGQTFSYGDCVWQRGYHRTRVKGGVISEGAHLRITAVGKDIVRVEACD